jgi:hypothetical protein
MSVKSKAFGKVVVYVRERDNVDAQSEVSVNWPGIGSVSFFAAEFFRDDLNSALEFAASECARLEVKS